jgi:TolB-like protein/Flp pilus assembly protein TadD
MRLSPRDPLIGISTKYLGDAELGLGHFDAAIEDYHKAIDLGMLSMWPYASLTAAYALAGKMDDAKAVLAEARRLEPKLTIKFVTLFGPPIPNLFEGLRKAGLPEDAPAEPPHLSIVVLPFTNLSGDPSQDYFADGVTENLTTDLSRIRNSFVIARNTAFAYKGKNLDAREIGKELGVRYVLEGSVQREQNRVRVNAQLIDAESGAHLWADRVEEDVADLFRLQDQVVARLGNALGFELVKAEAGRSVRSKNPDLDMRGWALVWQAIPQPMPQKQNTYLAARSLFDQALKIDPDDADALAGEALTYLVERSFFPSSVEPDYEAKIIGQADRAIAVAPQTEEAYYAKSAYLLTTQRADEALRAAEAGLGMNPNSARLYGTRGGAEVALGRFEQGISDERQSMRLSPRDPVIGLRHMEIGFAELGLGHFDAAAEDYHKAIDTGFVNWIPYVGLALAHSLEGKTEEAKTALAEARGLNPKLTVQWLKDHLPFTSGRDLETLRKAGLPGQ